MVLRQLKRKEIRLTTCRRMAIGLQMSREIECQGDSKAPMSQRVFGRV